MCQAKVNFRSRVQCKASTQKASKQIHQQRSTSNDSLYTLKYKVEPLKRLRCLRAQTWRPRTAVASKQAKECQRNGQKSCGQLLNTSGISLLAISGKLATCLLIVTMANISKVVATGNLASGALSGGGVKGGGTPLMAPPGHYTTDQVSVQLLTGAEQFESLRRPQSIQVQQQPKQPVKLRNTDKRPQPELTFRQATTRLTANETQWIPIPRQQPAAPRHHPKPKPQQNQRPPPVSNGNAQNNRARPRHKPNRPPNTNHQMQADASRSRQQFYRPPMGHYGPPMGPGGSWRRPRLNDEPGFDIKAHRYYKKVLICDKTLVSLDYVRSLDVEPRPQPLGSHYYDTSSSALYDGNSNEPNSNDNFIDNFLDLDTNLVEFSSVLPSRDSSQQQNQQPPVALSPRSSAGDLNYTTIIEDLADSNLSAPDTLQSSATTTTILANDRRSYLSDEDPLVKCDMWDLEKGLKKRKPPEHILRIAVKADFDTVRDAINRCGQLTERTIPAEDEYGRDQGLDFMSTEDLVSLFSMKRGLLPGTKWCGLGDQASSYNDLGPKHRVDICCRAHDHCPIRLKPFRNDYGVLNIALYTKSHCDCDADFYRCLRDVRSRTADMLGNLYFNVMKLQCMREERMKICREMKPIALGFERCVRYEDSPVKTVFKFTTPPVAY